MRFSVERAPERPDGQEGEGERTRPEGPAPHETGPRRCRKPAEEAGQPLGGRKATRGGALCVASAAVASQLTGCSGPESGLQSRITLQATLALLALGGLMGILVASVTRRREAPEEEETEEGDEPEDTETSAETSSDTTTTESGGRARSARRTTGIGIWVSVAGERWHRCLDCRGLRGARSVRRHTPCRLCVGNPGRTPGDDSAWASPGGERWHSSPTCRGLRGARSVKRFTPCGLCTGPQEIHG